MQILITENENFSRVALERLAAMGQVRSRDLRTREELLAEAAQGTEVLWVRLRHYIGREAMEAAPGLQAIATPTTGLTHVDLEEAARRGIAVISLKGETEFLKEIRATAEHTIGLMLALLRRLPGAARHVVEGGWNRDLFRGHELHGKTVGVVGYGRLGRIVARYLDAFGCRVLVSERKDWEGSLEPPAELVPLEELLSHSDLVSLHVSLDSTTTGLFDRACFGRMKSGAWFINTSRGELVDEAALLGALREGKLAGAAVDVLAAEHRLGEAGHPLIEYAREGGNIVITPHTGGCTYESMAKTEEFLALRLETWLSARALEKGTLCAESQALQAETGAAKI
ncbi:MAG: NAD(P)-dependent oxidoreductase [Bryobacteraceae bacterium]